ncbi:hypothetical protein WMY93_005809 [Mugilogobius chulae]|uniref:Uncharacterized protein n=1 Tax=Mugilogobius chulae TaxID=88201 RepID=A0AAW0PL12_9GOBI
MDLTPTPSGVNSQGLCPVLDGPAPPSSTPILPKTTNLGGQEHVQADKALGNSGSQASQQPEGLCDSLGGQGPPTKICPDSKSCPEKTQSKKRTFASMAKKVIMQERLRKAEEDVDEDDLDEEPEEDLSVDQLEKRLKKVMPGPRLGWGSTIFFLLMRKTQSKTTF